MSVTVTKKENSTAEIVFTISAETFAAAQTAVFNRRKNKINVPGFRPGKAPRHIVEKMYGRGIFYNDALDACLPAAFDAAIAQAALKPVGRPDFEIENIDETTGVTVKATISLYPVVTIGNYKGLSATRTEAVADESEIDAELDQVRARNSRTIEITDRVAEMGDTANIDFEGFLDGVAFDGGKGEGFDLKLGSGQFIPGFEEKVAGHEIGTDFDISVTFPEDYGAEQLAGKEVTFKVKLNALKREELPAADDEFAKDVSEFDTIADYRASLAAKIVERKTREQDKAVDNELSEALIAALEGDIPTVMYQREAENFVRDFDNRLRMQGMELKTYLQYTNSTIDKLREQYLPQAQKQVKMRLALEKIAELEALVASDAEADAEIDAMAASYNMERDEILSRISPEFVKEDLKVKKAFDFVRENAKIESK